MCAVQPEEAVAARPDVDGRRRRHAPEVGRGARARHPRQDARQRLQVQELRRPPRPLSQGNPKTYLEHFRASLRCSKSYSHPPLRQRFTAFDTRHDIPMRPGPGSRSMDLVLRKGGLGTAYPTSALMS